MVKVLQVHGRYDGILCGTCEYGGAVCWFSCKHMKDIFVERRTYRVFRLSRSDRFRIRVGEWIFNRVISRIGRKNPKRYMRIFVLYHRAYDSWFSVRSENDLDLIGAFGENEYVLERK